jgi:hypothetical protein
VQLGLLQTPILKCTIMTYCKYYKAKILSKEDARCLPWSREEKNKLCRSLAYSPIQRGQNLCGMMHEVNIRYNDRDGKSNMAHLF